MQNSGNSFIKSFQNEFEKFVIGYAEQSINDLEELDNILWYTEQQAKTAVTCALNEPCNGFFIQEPAVSRRKRNTRPKNLKDYKKGRVDYYCRFGGSTKIGILMEVKHHWINLHNHKKNYASHKTKIMKDDYTLYKIAKDCHNSAIKQIKNIKKDEYNFDNLYGAALTILPIFTRYKKKDDKKLILNNSAFKELCKCVLGETNSNACGGFVIPKKLQEITNFYDDKTGKDKFESFPGVILLWNLFKFTRK